MDQKVEPARVLGVLFLAGASLALISLGLPHPPVHTALLGTLIIVSCVIGALVFFYADQVSARLMNAILFVATALVGASIYASEVAGGVYGSLFYWAALYAGLFCSRRMAAAHVVWIISVNAFVLTQVSNPIGFSPLTRWLLMAISIVVITGVTHWIAADRNRLDGERENRLLQADLLAHTDPLTGLPNRRAWDATIALALDLAGAQASPLCVAVIDVDNLKRVNDREGHAAGDALLQRAARTWKESLRDRDYIARYGGDEFALLLNGCALDEAEGIIERLRSSAPAGHTYSAGAAAWDGAETAADLIRRADASLYAAKAAGRDRLSLAVA